jgi:hypothetical protein
MFPGSWLSQNSIANRNSLAFEYVVGFDQVFICTDGQAMYAGNRRRGLLSSL